MYNVTASRVLYIIFGFFQTVFMPTPVCVCFVFLQEECAMSDPQGESDADADIEDTDCRFDVHKYTESLGISLLGVLLL